MKHVLSASNILGAIETDGITQEVCATADAGYDEATEILTVQLDAFLRSAGNSGRERKIADWLPEVETISEAACFDEAGDLARDIFRRWAIKVRRAIPALAAAG